MITSKEEFLTKLKELDHWICSHNNLFYNPSIDRTILR